MLNFRATPEITDALNQWIAQQPDPKPSRSEAIRVALKDWLTGMGLLQHREDPEGTN